MSKKIYVAGPYSAGNVIDILKNIGTGRKVCAYLFALGFYPFSPWADADFIIDNPHHDFNIDQFYQYSMAWLEVSDAVFIVPGWETSKGTLAEIEKAKGLGLPVFEHIKGLMAWAEMEGEK